MDNIPKPELPKLILSSNSSHSSYSSRLVNTLNAMKSQREAEQISKASQTETTLAEAICNKVFKKMELSSILKNVEKNKSTNCRENLQKTS